MDLFLEVLGIREVNLKVLNADIFPIEFRIVRVSETSKRDWLPPPYSEPYRSRWGGIVEEPHGCCMPSGVCARPSERDRRWLECG